MLRAPTLTPIPVNVLGTDLRGIEVLTIVPRTGTISGRHFSGMKRARMANDKTSPKSIPPYVSFKTFDGFLEGLRTRGIPSRIDRSLMSNLSGASQSQLMVALRY